MPPMRFRFTLGVTMRAVAGIALVLALVQSASLVGLALASLTILIGSVWGIARMTGRPMTQTGTWLCAVCPGITVALTYSTWAVAWLTLGHRPRVNLDDPFRISEAVSFLGLLSYLGWFATKLWTPYVGLVLCCAEAKRLAGRDTPNRDMRLFWTIVLPPLLWLGGRMLFALGPADAGEWLAD